MRMPLHLISEIYHIWTLGLVARSVLEPRFPPLSPPAPGRFLPRGNLWPKGISSSFRDWSELGHLKIKSDLRWHDTEVGWGCRSLADLALQRIQLHHAQAFDFVAQPRCHSGVALMAFLP